MKTWVTLVLIAMSITGYSNSNVFLVDSIDCECIPAISPFEEFSLVPDTQPFSIDIDGDGDMDMLAGGDGELFFFENNGDGTYTDHTNTVSDIMPNLNHMDMTIGLCDLDGDGDYDMSIVGNETSNNRFYWNTGTKTSPIFTLAGTGGTPANPIAGFNLAALDGGYWIGYADVTIFWVDLDNDGDFDAVLGGKLGWFVYYENVGDENNPFFIRRTGAANPFDGLRAHGEDEGTPSNPCPGSQYCQWESAPFLIDFDADGDYDMFSGNQNATIQYFENIGSAKNPIYVERTQSDNPLNGIKVYEDAHLVITDADTDGDWELFYGHSEIAATSGIALCDLAAPISSCENNTTISILASATDLNCHSSSGTKDGQIDISVSGGTAPYAYNWSNSSDKEDQMLLGAGIYGLTVTDAVGCTQTDSYVLTEPQPITVEAQVTHLECEEQLTGAIDISIAGGQGNGGTGYTYQWYSLDGQNNFSSSTRNLASLSEGTYTLIVSDANGCTASHDYTIVSTDFGITHRTLFYADFENGTGDNDWKQGGSASDGDFEVGIPTPYYTAGNLMEISAHTGNQSLLTGVNEGSDLDGGPSTSRSGNIEISPEAFELKVSFSWYFSHAYNSSPDDYMNIELREVGSDKILKTLVNVNGNNVLRPAEWIEYEELISGLAGKSVYFWIEAADIVNGSKLEVAFDEIRIEETSKTKISLDLPTVAVCIDEPLINLSGGFPEGGSFSGPAVSGNTFSPTIAGVGTHTLTYSYWTNRDCIGMATQMITVHDLTVVQMNLTTDEYCENQTPITLTGGSPLGGTYSGAGVVNGVFDAGAAGLGIHTITYIYSDNNGCQNSATDDVEVTKTYDEITDVTICEEELPFEWNEMLIDSAGSYTAPGVDNNGCDIKAILNLTINASTPDVVTDMALCESDLPYCWNEIDFFESGVYTFPIVDVKGCTYNEILNLIVLPRSADIITEITILDTELPYLWNGLEITSAGTYYYDAEDQNGCTYTEELNLTINKESTSSIDEPTFSSRIYPNPAKDILYIETDEELGLTISDVVGRTLLEQKLASGRNEIITQHLRPGIYSVRIFDNEKARTYKIYVE